MVPDLGCVFVSYCCCNKLPQIQCLKTTHLLFRSCSCQKSAVGLSELNSLCRLQRRTLPCLFQPLEAVRVLLVVSPPSAKPAVQCVQMSLALTLPLLPPSFTYIRTLVISLGPSKQSGIIFPFQGQLISNLNSVCNLNSLLLCNNSFTDSGDQDTVIFGEAIILPATASSLAKSFSLLDFSVK